GLAGPIEDRGGDFAGIEKGFFTFEIAPLDRRGGTEDVHAARDGRGAYAIFGIEAVVEGNLVAEGLHAFLHAGNGDRQVEAGPVGKAERAIHEVEGDALVAGARDVPLQVADFAE